MSCMLQDRWGGMSAYVRAQGKDMYSGGLPHPHRHVLLAGPMHARLRHVAPSQQAHPQMAPLNRAAELAYSASTTSAANTERSGMQVTLPTSLLPVCLCACMQQTGCAFAGWPGHCGVTRLGQKGCMGEHMTACPDGAICPPQAHALAPAPPGRGICGQSVAGRWALGLAHPRQRHRTSPPGRCRR